MHKRERTVSRAYGGSRCAGCVRARYVRPLSLRVMCNVYWRWGCVAGARGSGGAGGQNDECLTLTCHESPLAGGECNMQLD